MQRRCKRRKQRVGVLLRNINVLGGQVPVTISIVKSLRMLGFSTILLCGEKVNKIRIENNFGVNLQLDKELVLPIWRRSMQTYFEFLLPFIAKPLCDILVNPQTNDLLPLVDVTYIHYPKQAFLRQKMRKQKYPNYFYKPYETVERSLATRTTNRLVIANSYFTANVVSQQIGIQPVVIYPPVFLKNLENSKLTTKDNIILTISRFSPEKNLEQIPLVASKVDANFVILSSVTNVTTYHRVRKLLKKCGVEDRVTVILDSPNNLRVKMELLQKAKVYFHTMPFEPFGISIIEGMNAGCIPVVHDSGGAKEFVPQRWRYKDTEDAIQKIKEALDSWSPVLAENMKSIAYQFREEKFVNDFSSVLDSYIKEK